MFVPAIQVLKTRRRPSSGFKTPPPELIQTYFLVMANINLPNSDQKNNKLIKIAFISCPLEQRDSNMTIYETAFSLNSITKQSRRQAGRVNMADKTE